ncbi:MAG: hypothetical protein ACXWRE_01800 [Pseudobdellovibrionaceae bacterium]
MMTSMPSGTEVPSTTESWLVLSDYSTKYDVSVSTLRKRIKAEDINFRLEDGKYYIIDEPMSTLLRMHRPSLDSDFVQEGAHQGNQQAPNSLPLKSILTDKITMAKKDEPILMAANKLLTELKKAYTQIIHEKEEQTLLLKGEVADLKTLVRILEEENERLRDLK